MQKRTILYVITQGGPWGGAQKYVADLAEGAQEKFLSIVATGEPHGADDLQKRLKDNPEIDVIQLKHLRRDISPLHDLLAVFEIRRLYKKLTPDIVHLNSTKAGVIGSLASYKLNAVPPTIIYTVHGWIFHEPMSLLKRSLYRMLERWTARQKSKIIVLSEEDAQSGQHLGVPMHKLAVIPPGIERQQEILSRHDARAALREKTAADIPMDTPWIGTIANFFPTKGLDILLYAYDMRRDALHRAQCVLIGDGPEAKNLTTKIQELNLSDCVHLTGFLPDAVKYLNAFDVFVLPSRKEGLPYALLEAKLHGIPIIATDVGGTPSIIQDKETGRLVEKENPLELGQAMVDAITHPESSKAMAESGMNDFPSRYYVRERMIEDTMALYSSVLREGE